jgi:hypothetical protein
VSKRTAMVLDKMMVALQRALDDDDSVNLGEAQPEQVFLSFIINSLKTNRALLF